ncbi:hypothetical protein LSAT2_001086 [Lamellibrachia satsuma]|nr:hypothetical protein LSAT2_001086 [Lamellibrachia satsuma]
MTLSEHVFHTAKSGLVRDVPSRRHYTWAVGVLCRLLNSAMLPQLVYIFMGPTRRTRISQRMEATHAESTENALTKSDRPDAAFWASRLASGLVKSDAHARVGHRKIRSNDTVCKGVQDT